MLSNALDFDSLSCLRGGTFEYAKWLWDEIH